ncbi:hypothetical protein [Oceanobacillus jeddahense]|uniref:C4-dicarboxylate ABC transporter n=1 Tax=Oceanobacillus jeddahense TaxID=1462527 RepID=A0ABY5JRH8_9BACI|nr:hypothetical protein [Oceanobacillus jeddahense]UUI02927.1 hypothetical protein NP439_23330 [Oceanobacillus jeddahense]
MLRLFIYSALIILHIITMLWENIVLIQVTGIVANLAIFISFFYARGLYLYSGILFYLLGCSIFITNGLPWNSFFLQFQSMLGILSLFMMLPFLNSLIIVGRYDQHLSSLLQYKVQNAGDLYKRSSLVTHILGLFLNIATIPLVLKSLHKSLKTFSKAKRDTFYTQNLLRAYALCLMWSPMEIMVIQSLEMTGGNYLFIFPFLIIFSISMIFLDTLLGKFKYAELTVQQTRKAVSIRPVLKKIKELFTFLLLLVLSVTILNYILGKGYLFSLVLLILPISLLWAGKIHKLKRYFHYVIPHWKMKTKGQANFFCMFLSAGFFVNMLAETDILAILQRVYMHFSQQLFILFILIGLYFFVSSFIGFHPLVSITLLGEILQPILPNIAGIPLAFVLVTTSLSTIMYSPFNVSVSVLSNELKQNSYKLSLWNIPFSLLLIFLSILAGYLLHILFHLFS